MPRIVSVVVPVPSLGRLDYEVPPALPVPETGTRVLVPLGARVVTGCVVGRPPAPASDALKPLRGVLDGEPMLPADVVELALWVGEYYACGPGAALAAAMPPRALTPPRKGSASGFRSVRVASLTPAGRTRLASGASLGERQREALERLPREEPEAGPAPQAVRLEDRMRRLVRRLAGGAPLRFADLVAAASTRVEVIVDFLAVLELVRAGYAEARQDGAFGEIELAAVPGAAPPPAAAPAGDEAPAAGAGTAR